MLLLFHFLDSILDITLFVFCLFLFVWFFAFASQQEEPSVFLKFTTFIFSHHHINAVSLFEMSS